MGGASTQPSKVGGAVCLRMRSGANFDGGGGGAGSRAQAQRALETAASLVTSRVGGSRDCSRSGRFSFADGNAVIVTLLLCRIML